MPQDICSTYLLKIQLKTVNTNESDHNYLLNDTKLVHGK